VSAPFESLEPDWLDLREAITRVVAAGAPPPPISLTPLEALGFVLAEEVRARAALPPHDNTAMDGYAVRGADVRSASRESPVELRVVAHATPGPATLRPVETGEAIRITTGAPIPPGADSVIRVEDTDREATSGIVRILDARDIGRHIRPAGRDLAAGEIVGAPGDRIDPGTIGVLVGAGAREVEVHPKPTVAIVTTGDELVDAGAFDRVIAGDGIPDTNGPLLAAAAAEAGATPRIGPAVADDIDALIARFERELDADVLITVGGASMGTGDLVKRALDRIGFELDFWRVKLRPGSPFGLGRIPRPGRSPLPVLSLPGNPASAFVTFQLFARPLLMRLAGHTAIHRPGAVAVAAEPFAANPRLTMLPRVVLETDAAGVLHARSAGDQTSGLVRTLALADGLAVLPPADAPTPPGSPVRVLLHTGDGADAESPDWLDPIDRGHEDDDGRSHGGA
jgi:molybdopterin molybdotransferase